MYGGEPAARTCSANSLVALDAATGRSEVVTSRPYINELCGITICHRSRHWWIIVRDGKKIPALVQSGKTGLVFILDRRDGKPCIRRGGAARRRRRPCRANGIRPPNRFR